MRKILAGILIGVLCVGSLSGCGKGTSEETDSTISETVNATDETETDTQTESISETEAIDLNYTVPFSMADIDWNVEEGIVYGDRRYVVSYTNNSKYDIFEFNITYAKKADTTDEQLLNAFSDLREENGGYTSDSDIIDFEPRCNDYHYVVPGRKIDQVSLLADGMNPVTTEDQLNLFEPDMANIRYVDGDKIYDACYDFKNDKMNLSSPYGMDKYGWSDSDMAQKVPKPEYDIVIVNMDDADYFMYTIGGANETIFNEYKELCIKQGFTEKAESDDYSYEAYNADGLNLSMYYTLDGDKVTCTVEKE